MLNCKIVNAETSSPAVTENSAAVSVGWTILIVVTLSVCYFSHLGSTGFLGPDEPRYAWIARDMAESGDWVTPRLYGQPWFEKPVLYYWGAAASFKLFGVSEAAARLPSALAALLATLSLGWLALRLYGRETARWLLLLLPTSVAMIGFSHAASTDMPFSGMLTVAMVCAAVVVGLTRNEHSPGLRPSPWLPLILFGFFLGAAVLAKGPAALILSGGAIFFWALFTRRWPDAFRLFHPAALIPFFATALPWYLLCARRNPDFFHVFIIEHNFKRYLTPEFQHIQPFWYYLPVLLVALLPWTGIAIFTIYTQIKNLIVRTRPDDNLIFFWMWALCCILFFSTSHSKLPGYILPAFPACTVLLSISVVGRDKQAKLRYYLYAFSGLLIAAGLLFAASIVKLKQVSATDLHLVVGILLLIAAPGLCLAWALGPKLRPARKNGFAFASILMASLPVAASSGVLRLVDRSDSARFIAGETSALGLSEKVFTYHVNRSQTYGLNFYFHREIQEWNPSASPEALVITSQRECANLHSSQKFCRLIRFGEGTKGTALSLYTIRTINSTAQPSQ